VSLPGIDAPRAAGWIRDHVPDLDGDLVFERTSSGRSNLTFVVRDADGARAVLRRPPLGDLPPTAHNVLREARVMAALAGSGVPVPAVLAVCSDPDVIGGPFFVMEYLDGVVCVSADATAELLAPSSRHRAGTELSETLARLHDISPAEVGLEELGRGASFVERQLRRWHEQWQLTRVRELDELERAHEILVEKIPEQHAVSIVHGDYRLDNAVMTLDGKILGVLDWEISTLGDPLADLAIFLSYWAEPGDTVTILQEPPTMVAGFPSRDELERAYFASSGESAEDLSFYVAFAWWRIGCIVEGVYARTLSGALGSLERPASSFAEQGRRLAEHALELAGGLT
jgi:aminoglycoside phosphotransferase (APT) family kinase protein